MIKKMICSQHDSLLNVLQVINDNAKGIAFIVDERERLCGVLTDGDIRRLLLNGHNLQEKVHGVLTGKYVFAKRTEPYEDILKKINTMVKIIPIVDDDTFRVVDYFEYRYNVHMPVATPNLSGNEFKYLSDAFLSTWISSSGKYIERFEQDFAGFCECKYGVAVSNGTVALHLALLTLGIQKDDEVIVPDLTFAATINSVLHANATPLIVDVERESWCIDPVEIEKAITPRTRAIIPVHLYGQPCNMEAIMSIAKKYNLFVIEDCAEAHGARFDGKKVGSFGHIACFSFFGNKVITTGEGGMCLTNSKDLNERMKILRDHGMSRNKKYWHESIGYNYRMTNLQAAIGVAQVERIEDILLEKKQIENLYKERLVNIESLDFQRTNIPKREKITWLMCILLKNGRRDECLERLKKVRIDARPFFYSLGSMPIYARYIFSNQNSLVLSRMGINLPTIKHLDDTFFDKVVSILRS